MDGSKLCILASVVCRQKARKTQQKCTRRNSSDSSTVNRRTASTVQIESKTAHLCLPLLASVVASSNNCGLESSPQQLGLG